MTREPTDDERAGMDWWNGLDEFLRGYWAKQAGNTGVVADAWAAYKTALRRATDGPDVIERS